MIFRKDDNDQMYYQNVLNKIEVMVNEAFPIKLIKPSKVKISPPWYTGGLAEA